MMHSWALNTLCLRTDCLAAGDVIIQGLSVCCPNLASLNIDGVGLHGSAFTAAPLTPCLPACTRLVVMGGRLSKCKYIDLCQMVSIRDLTLTNMQAGVFAATSKVNCLAELSKLTALTSLAILPGPAGLAMGAADSSWPGPLPPLPVDLLMGLYLPGAGQQPPGLGHQLAAGMYNLMVGHQQPPGPQGVHQGQGQQAGGAGAGGGGGGVPVALAAMDEDDLDEDGVLDVAADVAKQVAAVEPHLHFLQGLPQLQVECHGSEHVKC